MPFTFAELFAGLGGFRLGLEAVGGSLVWACEKDRDAKIAYEANFGDRPYHDVTRCEPSKIPDHDVLCGGFPCQDFATMGPQEGLAGARGSLFFEIVRVAAAKRPKVLLLENVRGLLTMNEGADVKRVVAELENIGYAVVYGVRNISGALPQFRRRVFFVGFLDGEACERFRFPSNPMLTPLPTFADVQCDPRDPYLRSYTLAHNAWQRVQRSKASAKYGLRSRILLAGDTADTLIANYRKSVDGVAQFVATDDRFADGKDDLKKPRWLSPLECRRLMGFPETYKLHPHEAASYQLLGNTVVPPLVALLGGAAVAALKTDATKAAALRIKALEAFAALLVAATPADRRRALRAKIIECDLGGPPPLAPDTTDPHGEGAASERRGTRPHDRERHRGTLGALVDSRSRAPPGLLLAIACAAVAAFVTVRRRRS